MSFIVVQEYQFPVHDPFKEGHVLTETEANVLNWHRARLIQKIVIKWVTEAIDTAIESNNKSNGRSNSNGSSRVILSTEEVKALADRISEFDRDYVLSKAKEPKISILEYNLELLASNFLYKAGSEEPSREDIERIKRVPEIQARARDLIRSSTFSLQDLLV